MGTVRRRRPTVVTNRRVLATISVLGAVVAGILLGVILFTDQPTVLEVDFSPDSSPASESSQAPSDD
jgi:hypothetical protein